MKIYQIYTYADSSVVHTVLRSVRTFYIGFSTEFMFYAKYNHFCYIIADRLLRIVRCGSTFIAVNNERSSRKIKLVVIALCTCLRRYHMYESVLIRFP